MTKIKISDNLNEYLKRKSIETGKEKDVILEEMINEKYNIVEINKSKKIISIASDHAGYEIKEKVKVYLTNLNYEVIDYGTNNAESCDYPDYAHKLGKSINDNICDIGFLFCGSGNGVNMTVNKYKKVRSALCWNSEISMLSRLHNDANVCAIPARFVNYDDVIEIVFNFLHTDFEGGRHEKRVNKIKI